MNIQPQPVYGLFHPTTGALLQEGELFVDKPFVGYGVHIPDRLAGLHLPMSKTVEELNIDTDFLCSRIQMLEYIHNYSFADLLAAFVGCELSHGWSASYFIGCDFKTPEGVEGSVRWSDPYRDTLWPTEMATRSLKVVDCGSSYLIFEGVEGNWYFNQADFFFNNYNGLRIYEPEPYSLLKPK